MHRSKCAQHVGWLTVILLLGGCAAAERARVADRFSTMFQCPNPSVRAAAGGYVAEGCQTVAHFTCFDSDDDRDELVQPGSWAAVIGALLDGAAGRDTCMLEHVERFPGHRQPTPVARVPSESGVLIKTRLLIAGGHLVALGRPAVHPTRALLVFHSASRLPEAAPCGAELFDDGTPIPIEQTERKSDHEVRLLVPVDSLSDVDRAVRVAGRVCGAELELDSSAREALGLFHARFGEERTRVTQALASGGQRTVPGAPPSP